MVKPWQVVLATIGIFLAGLITGGAIALRYTRGEHLLQKEDNQWAKAGGIPLTRPANMNPEQLGPALIRRFATSEELNLGPVQKYKVQQISRTTGEKLVRLRRETALNSLLLIEEMQDEISAILTQPQKVKFEALLSEQREKMQAFKAKQQNELRKPAPDGQPQVPAPADAPGK